jgi:thioredoxin 1
MPLCCIGGVCIPYTAIIPLLLYGLQWILQKLADAGILPDSVCKQLQGFMITINNPNKIDKTEGNCCNNNKNEVVSNTSNVRRGKQIKDVDVVTSKDTTTTDDNNNNEATDQRATKVQLIQSPEEWERLTIDSEGLIIVCKFTATWCKPCKEIQPVFESMSNTCDSTLIRFATVDVDVLDDIASTYKVLSLPTFVTLQNGRVLEKYSGSNPEQLKNLISQSITKSSVE